MSASATERPPPVVRPDGRVYRPRRLVVQEWEDDWESGVLVLGTHDVVRARALALGVCHRDHGPESTALFVATGWYRDGYAYGERAWIHDDVRGRAGVKFEVVAP